MHGAGAGEGEGPLPPADGHIRHRGGGWAPFPLHAHNRKFVCAFKMPAFGHKSMRRTEQVALPNQERYPAGSLECSLGLNNVLGRAEDVSVSFELGMNNSTVQTLIAEGALPPACSCISMSTVWSGSLPNQP